MYSSQKGEKCTREKEKLLEASSRCDKVTQNSSNELVKISMVCIKVHTYTMYQVPFAKEEGMN